MKNLVRDLPVCMRSDRDWFGRKSAVSIAVLTLLACIGLSGCNRGPAGLVPVSGKLTLDSKAWPKSGQINFSPVKPAEGHPVLPAMARIKEDGTFEILTPDAPGLLPGDYNVAVTCMKEAGDDRHAGKSAIPGRYSSPRTSGLKVTIAEGSKPVVLNLDLKSK